MAEKDTKQAQANETTEKQAYDANGKLKSGYAYRYENYRDKDGNLRSRKVVFKQGS